ncbi:hypothetical protein F7725_005039 [Dissostichus mawsoni]|uniref:Uncharacterized protein n=1 Tax=Dissostichus mawsoni TaxID=36200 RepID=A0A7J5XKF7_DISMA|nr:hypothetical protein F7725_005039 [Dissostichus mawsoni]
MNVFVAPPSFAPPSSAHQDLVTRFDSVFAAGRQVGVHDYGMSRSNARSKQSSSLGLSLHMDLASFGDPPEDLSKALALPQSVQPFLGTKLRRGEGEPTSVLTEGGASEEGGGAREREAGRERLKSQKQEVEERAAYLSRQVCAAVEMMERLKKDLEGKDQELNERQQSVPAHFHYYIYTL